MKKLIIILLAMAQTVWAQEITGSWSGELAVQGTRLPLVFNISREGDGYKTTMDSPRQGVKDIAIQETRYENGELTISAPSMGLKYTGKLMGENTLEGTFSQGGMSLPLTFQRGVPPTPAPAPAVPERKRPQTPQPPYSYYTEDVTFKNEKEGNLLAGTLVAPGENKDAPMLVMITGSGRQNRDSELAGHKPFLVIADYLAKKGIGTLRLDDRGIGGSEAGKPGATSEDFAGDISSAVNFLAAKGYKNIGLIGHSEGGLIAPMVNGMNKKVKFMVLMAGPGIAITDLMVLQTYEVTRAMGAPEPQAKTAAEINTRLYALVNNYKGNDLETEIRAFLKKEIPALTEPQLEASVKQVTDPWFRYFLAFDPGVYLSKVKVPVLALNGNLDTQVTSKENLEGIRKSLTRAGNKNFEIVPFENLNHLFQTAKTGSVSEYAHIEETIAPAVLEKIGAWVSGRF